MNAKKHHHTQSRARDAVSLVFAFFLSIALVGMMLLTVLRVGLLTKDGFMSVLDDQYCEYLLTFIEEQSEYYTLPTGIDPVVLEDVFEFQEVRQNVDNYVSSVFGGYTFKPDVARPRERLEANVRNAFVSDGVVVDKSEEADEVASAYVDEVIAFYADTVQPAGLDSAVKVANLYSKYYLYAMLGCSAFALVMVVLLVRLHHFVHRSLRYMAYAFGGAALMGFVVPAVLFVLGTYKGLNLSPQYFYHFGVTLIERVFMLCMLGSLVLVAAMAVMALVVARLRKGAMQKKRIRRYRQG